MRPDEEKMNYPTYPELEIFSDALSIVIKGMVERDAHSNNAEALFELHQDGSSGVLSQLTAAVAQPILHLSEQGDHGDSPEDITPFIINCQLAVMHGPITKGRLIRIERAIILIDQIINSGQLADDDDMYIALHVIERLAPFYDRYIGLMSSDARVAYDHLIASMPQYVQPTKPAVCITAIDVEQTADSSSDQGNYFNVDDDSATITARPGKLFLEQFYEHSVLPNWENVNFGEIRWLRHDAVDERTSSHSFEAEDGEIYSLVVSDELPTKSPFRVHGERFKLVPLSDTKRIYCNRKADSAGFLDAITGYFRLYQFVG